MKTVVAVGGNALFPLGHPPDLEQQRLAAERAAQALTPVAETHSLIVTLDVRDAERAGMLIGCLLDQELTNALPNREIVTLLTRVRVDEHDLAFLRPTKPIGPVYDEETARKLAAAHNFAIGRDGDGWRRMVAAPEPVEILPLRSIERLVAAGVVVIVAGGGDPIVVDNNGKARSVPAVIDPDVVAALLAISIGADVLVLCTDQRGVYDNFGASDARLLDTATPEMLRRMHFAPDTMGPKVEAGVRFVEATGGRAAIGSLEDAAALVEGAAGSQVRRASVSAV